MSNDNDICDDNDIQINYLSCIDYIQYSDDSNNSDNSNHSNELIELNKPYEPYEPNNLNNFQNKNALLEKLNDLSNLLLNIKNNVELIKQNIQNENFIWHNNNLIEQMEFQKKILFNLSNVSNLFNVSEQNINFDIDTFSNSHIKVCTKFYLTTLTGSKNILTKVDLNNLEFIEFDSNSDSIDFIIPDDLNLMEYYENNYVVTTKLTFDSNSKISNKMSKYIIIPDIYEKFKNLTKIKTNLSLIIFCKKYNTNFQNYFYLNDKINTIEIVEKSNFYLQDNSNIYFTKLENLIISDSNILIGYLIKFILTHSSLKNIQITINILNYFGSSDKLIENLNKVCSKRKIILNWF